jgi:hypothetical protein
MTRTDLLDVVYCFYPRGLLVGAKGYDDTEEVQRQRDAARRGVTGYPTWKAMIRRLGARYPVTDRSVCILAGWRVPAYSAEIEIPGRTLGFHVSLLGPYYGIHRTGAVGEEEAAPDLVREIEATYPGYAPIAPELGDEVVPDVCLDTRPFGKVTIHDCLLSVVWDDSSGPWPPAPYRPPTAAERREQHARTVQSVKAGWRWGRAVGLSEREALALLDEDAKREADDDPKGGDG